MALRTIAVAIFLLSILSGGVSVMALEREQVEIQKVFLILYRPGPDWDPSKRVWEQALGGHKDYLVDHYASGVLKFAGPFTDDWGGGVVVQTDDAEAAADIARNDPAVLNGVFAYEIHPWFLVDWKAALAERDRADNEAGDAERR